MYADVCVNDDIYVNLDFTDENNKKILNQLKFQELSEEKLNTVKKALDILKDSNINFHDIMVYCDNIELDDDTINDAYNEINWDQNDGDTYEDGYDSALDNIERQKKALKDRYSTLFHKLDKLVYNYGNPENLTKEEIRDILNILEYNYD